MQTSLFCQLCNGSYEWTNYLCHVIGTKAVGSAVYMLFALNTAAMLCLCVSPTGGFLGEQGC